MKVVKMAKMWVAKATADYELGQVDSAVLYGSREALVEAHPYVLEHPDYAPTAVTVMFEYES